jgi:hypothetical protein
VVAHREDERLDPSRVELSRSYRDGGLVVFGAAPRPRGSPEGRSSG